MDKISLFTRHSFASCVVKGWTFLAGHFLLLSKVMLPYFTVLSLVGVVFMAYNIKLNVATVAYGMVSLEEILLSMLLFTLTWAIGVISLARLFLCFRRLTALEIPKPEEVMATRMATARNTMRRTMQLAWRSIPYTIWILLLNMPGFPIIEPLMTYIGGLSKEYMILAIFVLLLVAGIALVFLTPLVYTFYCRMMKPTVIVNDDEREQAFAFKKAYRKGFRHKGKIFSLTLWSAFLLFVGCAVILLPGIVATEAYLSSIEGNVNFGDSTLIPASGYAIMIVVGAIALTFCCLLKVAFNASLMYLFGDIYSK